MQLVIQPGPQCVTLNYVVDRDMARGELLRLRADGLVGMRAIESLQVTANDRELLLIQRFDPAAMQRDFNWFVKHRAVATVEVAEPLPAGTEVRIEAVMRGFTSSGQEGGPLQAPNPYAGLTWRYDLVCATLGDARANDWQPVSPPVDLELLPGPMAELEAYLRPGDQLAIAAFDAWKNPVAPDVSSVTVADRRVRLDPSRPVTQIDCTEDRVRIETDGHRQKVAGVRERSRSAELSPGFVEFSEARHKVAGVRERSRSAELSPGFAEFSEARHKLSTARPRTPEGRWIYFGEFHWHTDLSGDGQRPITESLTSARDELCLDFAGASEHLGTGIAYAGGTIEDQRDLCEPFNRPGQFVVVPTYERSEREGHVNIIADEWDTLLAVARATDRSEFPKHRFPWKQLAAACPAGRAIIVPHHPNMDSHVREGVVDPATGRPYWCRMDWGADPHPDVARLVEIHQGRGSFEGETPDANWRIDVGGFGSSVRTALARGFRLGFTGGTDNHSGWPNRCPSGWCGLTAVQAERLTRESIFEALHARRCYATTGVRIVADFTCNGLPMGSEIRQAPGGPRTFDIMVRGTAPLAQVQVVSCGAMLADLPVEAEAMDFRATWTDQRPGRPLRDCYYYVRARQVDGHCVWMSPIWFDLPGD